ncbi:hypothetical protein [Sphingobium sp. EM0848]|uniref:hypothetical protein n=1 Tax=Sphingobium sp. EM0848 TaxID=2743473 RepID=UPI001C3FB5F4|nr:hypothetical protein [Sphingobium sp. EM0848]
MPKIYVPNVEEFAGLIADARGRSDCVVRDLGPAYTLVEGAAPLRFVRRTVGMRPAIWYSMFSGGLDGRLSDFGWDEVTVLDA